MGPTREKLGALKAPRMEMSRIGTFVTHSKIEEQGELAESAFRG